MNNANRLPLILILSFFCYFAATGSLPNSENESLMPDPPTAVDIEVCEGGSTTVIPIGDMGGGVTTTTIYSESFDTDGEGLAGDCLTGICDTDVPPANGQWTLGGDLSGLTATSDFAITSGGTLNFQDTDAEVCFVSSMINIGACSTSNFSVDISEVGSMESSDYVDVNFIVDGVSTTIGNWLGLGDATHTLIDDFTSATVTQSSITGTFLSVQICVMNNAGTELTSLDNINIECESTGGNITFKYYDADPATGATPVFGPTSASYDPMTVPGTTDDIWITACDATGESPATMISVTVNEVPAVPIATSASFCNGDLILDIVPTGEVGALFSYYSDAALMNLIQSGPSYTPMGTIGTEFVFITQTVNGCESQAVQSSIEVLANPTAPIAQSLIFCIDEPVSPVEATGEPTASFIYYSDAALTNVISIGALYTPMGTAGTETVFVTQQVNGCESAATQITITVAGFENITVVPTCNAGGLDYCLDITFDFAGPGPSNMYEVIVNGVVLGPFSYGATGSETLTVCDPVNFIGDEQMAIAVEIADLDRGNITAGVSQTGGGASNLEGCVEIGSVLPAQNADNDGDGLIDFCDEFITLTNGGTAVIDLSEYTVSDAIAVRHIFPAGFILNPGQTLTLFNSNMNQLANCAGSGIWNNGGDDVILLDASGTLVDMETYNGSTVGVAITFAVEGCGMGMTMGTGPSACLQINSVLANQQNDNDEDGVVNFCDEFITVANPGNMALDISGYMVSDGAALRHIVPAGTILAPGQILSIFNSDLSEIANCAGVGIWNNGGDDITITDAAGMLVDMESYGGTTAGQATLFDVEECPITMVDPTGICSGIINFDEPNCCPVIEVTNFMALSICAGSCPIEGQGLMASGECGNIAGMSETKWFSDPAGMFLVFEGDVFDPVGQGLVDNNEIGETIFYAQVSCDFCLSELVPVKVDVFDCDPPNDACGGCTYFVQLYDAGFNGWDGARFLVSVNEGPFEEFKPTAEDGACLVFPIDIIDGGSIDYIYEEGANAEEHAFKILDAFGQVVAAEGIQFTGNNIVADTEQTVKAECPACCTDAAEIFTFVFTAGLDAVEKSWEIRDNDGTRVAFANAGQYAGVFSGQTISTTLTLDPCEEYAITTFAARNNGWEGGLYELFSSNPERGEFVSPGVYRVAQGPDDFMDFLSSSFTLPCSIECPAEETILADDLGACLLNSYTAELIDAPTCYPNNCHASIAPVLDVCYPSAIGGLVEGPLGTTSASLPVGSNPIIYKVTYSDGQIRRCTSEVHVISEINPVLACNDFVTVPLVSDGVNCETVITADMILEAPDPCNAQYLIELTDANGVSMGNVINFSDAGQTFTYSITQIGTGLTAICHGQVFIEDKLAPTIECFDYEINCNHPDALNELYSHTENFEVTSEELPGNIAGGTDTNPSELILPIPNVGCGPHGEVIQDINVSINLVHNDLEDLTIILFTPNGSSITLLERRTCNNSGSQNLNVTFDSEAGTAVFAACSSGFPGLSGRLQPAQPLSLLYDLPFEDLQGDWSLLVRDDDDTAFEGIGVGEVISVDLEITAGFPFPYAANDCNLQSVTLIDEQIVDTNCDQGEWLGANIVRVWQAIDVFGNATNCTQTVALRAPMLSDFDLPEDIELECGEVPTDPALITADISGDNFFECFNVEDSQTNLCDILITYVDNVLPSCGNSVKIFRTWEIHNWCANTVLTHEQIITITDNVGPSIAQANIVVGTNDDSCVADVLLDDLSITDACSEITDVTASYFIGSSITFINLLNGEAIEGLAFGSNSITVSATDACSNVTTQEVIITVVDDVNPTASCNDGLNISLSDSGSGFLSAEEFDEGSSDNCSDVSVLIRSLGCEGGVFGPTAEFSCCDLGMVAVELMVTDAAGNTNICWAELLVEDPVSPIIICQSDVTIDCDEGLHGPDLFEVPDVSDNCSTNISEGDIIVTELPNCGQLLRKTYTVSDGSDKTDDASCTQSVTIIHTSDFIVQFPDDISFDDCPEELANIPGPMVSEDDCEQVAISIEDRVFDQVEDACYIIERTYTIINHCRVDNPDMGTFTDLGTPLPIPRTFRDDDGYFQYTQIVTIQDDEAPSITFTAPDPCDFSNECEGEVTLTATGEDACSEIAALIYSWKIDAFSDGSVDIEGEGSDASGVYPYGNHLIKWTVSDGCGNATTEEFEFAVLDCKNPTPICEGLSTVVMNNGDCVELFAAHLLKTAEDNCTVRTEEEWLDNARVRFAGDAQPLSQSIQICCADVFLGLIPVEVWIEDEAGNADFCIVEIAIQDNLGNCSDTGIGAATLISNVKTENGQGVSDVTVLVEGQDMGLTNDEGVFGADLEAGEYRVEPQKLDEVSQYISTFDLVLMANHVLQLNFLDSPYKYIAADVNLDGTIDVFDMVELRQLILFSIIKFEKADSWVFIPSEYEFQNSSNPLDEDYPLFLDVEITDDVSEVDFIAVKMGNLDELFLLTGDEVEGRNFPNDLNFKIEDENLAQDEEYIIDFKASDFEHINGFQYTLGYDPEKIEIVDFIPGELPIAEQNYGKSLLEEGRLTSSFHVMGEGISVLDNEILFSVKIVAKEAITLSKEFRFVDEFTLAEAYQNVEDIMGLALEFEQSSLHTTSKFKLHQNTPNPFTNSTSISFELPSSTEATLKVFDVTGKLLLERSGHFEAGLNAVNIEAIDFDISGLVYYTLETKEHKAQRKMLIIK